MTVSTSKTRCLGALLSLLLHSGLADAQDETTPAAESAAPAEPGSEASASPASAETPPATESATPTAEPAAEPGAASAAQTADTIPVEPLRAESQPPPKKPEGSGDTTRLESIVVTANKREQLLLDVPMSISAVQGKDLEKNGAKTFADYAQTVPALNFGNYGEGRQRINLRGLQAPTGVATVAYLVDGVAQSETPPDAELFDIDRIEILRGPQGTLYGEGAVGGAIKLLTNSANPNVFQARALGGIGVNEAGARSDDINAMINVPLADNKLGLRVVGFRRNTEGYITVREPDFENPPGLKSYSSENILATGANSIEAAGGRVALDWMATPDLSLKLKYNGEIRTAFYGPAQSPELEKRYGPYNVTRGTNPLVGDLTKHDYRQTTLGATWNTDWVNIESTTGVADVREDLYTGVFVILPLVQTAGTIVGLPLAAPGLPGAFTPVLSVAGVPNGDSVADMFNFALTNDYRYRTQEFRFLSVPGDGPWTLTGGLFYKDQHRTAVANVLPGPNLEVLGEDRIDLLFTSKEYSVYGQAEYAVTQDLTAVAGVRYFKAKLLQTATGGGTDGTVYQPRYRDVSPKFTLSYHLTETALVYATAAKGFRVGGANFNTVNPPPDNFPPTYDPDVLWSYELGVNSALFDGRMTANAAIFTSNWENLQNEILMHSDAALDPGGATPDDPTGFFAPGGDQRAVINAGKAYARGVEFELTTILPLDLTWTLGGAYLDAAIAHDLPNPALDGDVIPKGTSLENVPKLAGSTSLSHDFRFAGGLGLSSAVTWVYRGEAHSDILNPRASISPAYDLVNVRFGLKGEGRSWDADLFANNVLDKRASSFTFQSTDTDLPLPRRTLGMRVSYSF